MNVLSSSSLFEALKACDKHAGARIGIACSPASAKELVDSLWTGISCHRLPGWEMGRAVNSNHATIRKKVKGEYSFIEVFPVYSFDNIVGKSYHLILYDVSIDDAFIEELAWCERLSFDGSEYCGSKMLDEFLNSFKIV